VFVGGVGFLIQTIVFELLSFYLGLVTPSTATLLGGECGILANFFLNERISFADRVGVAGHYSKRLLTFHSVVSVSLLIQWATLFTAEHFTSSILYLHMAYIAGLVLGFISNLFGYHMFVWKGVKESKT
jgi:putative flippase GtrA